MRKIFLLIAVGLLGVAMASADTLCANGQNVMTPGFSCSFGGLDFTNFQVVSAAPGTVPSMVIVSANQIGSEVYLNFNPSLAVTDGVSDMWFYMTVTGGINGIDLGVGGSNAAVTERACLTAIDSNAGNTCVGGVGNQLAAMAVTSGNANSATFPGGTFSSPVYIFKNLLVQGPGELSAVSQSFNTAVPEPVTFGLIGSGLLLLGLLRRRAR